MKGIDLQILWFSFSTFLFVFLFTKVPSHHYWLVLSQLMNQTLQRKFSLWVLTIQMVSSSTANACSALDLQSGILYSSKLVLRTGLCVDRGNFAAGDGSRLLATDWDSEFNIKRWFVNTRIYALAFWRQFNVANSIRSSVRGSPRYAQEFCHWFVGWNTLSNPCWQ